MRYTPAIAAVMLIGASAPSALAWNDYGHELVAYIAYQDLKPEVRARVNALLKQHPQYDLLAQGCPASFDKDEYVFMKAATWPDMVRSTNNPLHGTDHHSKWHYINLPIDQDGMHGRTPSMDWRPASDPENAVQALAKTEADFKDGSIKDPDKAKDLCWFLHVVGDIHQPLHATNLYSAEYPKGDEGGNLFWVSDGHRPLKLHALWDDVLGTGKDLTKVAARGVALTKRPDLSRSALAAKIADTTFADWSKESADLCETAVYENGAVKGVKAEGKEHAPKDAPELPQGYKEQAEKLAEQQVVLAGYRLADTLNACVPPAPAPGTGR